MTPSSIGVYPLSGTPLNRNRMKNISSIAAVIWSLAGPVLIGLIVRVAAAAPGPEAAAQAIDERSVSEHIRIRIPIERESLGRDVIMELERCYRFINAATGDRMPRRIVIDVLWNRTDSGAELREARLFVGMGDPAAEPNARGFLIRSASRELARLGLLSLSKGGTVREDTEFLMEGMSEILAHDFTRSTRSLTGAWIVAQSLDRMNLLGFKVEGSWAAFSRGRHDMRAAAPGITFLLACRETYGRDRTLKLFENLHRGTLEEELQLAFRSTARELEVAWLKKVREFSSTDDYTVTSDEDAPALEKTQCIPADPKPGSTLQVRLFIRTGANALRPEEIFLQDVATGKVYEGQAAGETDAKYYVIMVPVETAAPSGNYNYRVVALDEGGNIRHWPVGCASGK